MGGLPLIGSRLDLPSVFYRSLECIDWNTIPPRAEAVRERFSEVSKTKDVDVVVLNGDIGPCIAISVKGTLNAFRNLTNRMEEAAGDCTNLHLSYPALVYAFFHVIRANRPSSDGPASRKILKYDEKGVVAADRALDESETPSDAIARYHDALIGLQGRTGLRDEPSRYEAVCLVLADPDSIEPTIFDPYPIESSPLRFEAFLPRILTEYDQRFVYPAPALKKSTSRLVWAPDSPALVDLPDGFKPRIA